MALQNITITTCDRCAKDNIQDKATDIIPDGWALIRPRVNIGLGHFQDLFDEKVLCEECITALDKFFTIFNSGE